MDLSIIITSYNCERFLRDCIDSCLNQFSHSLNYEVIVVDDGSTDNTSEILKKYTSKQFKSFKINNSGVEKAANFGLQKAKGRYFVRVDADDMLSSNYLKELELYIVKDVDVIYSDYNDIDETGKVTREVSLPDYDSKEILKRGDFLATGTILRASLFNHKNVYNPEIKNSGLESYELILKLIQKNFSFCHVPLRLFSYRRHSQNLSSKNIDKIIKHGKALFLKNSWGEYNTNEFHPYELKLNIQ